MTVLMTTYVTNDSSACKLRRSSTTKTMSPSLAFCTDADVQDDESSRAAGLVTLHVKPPRHTSAAATKTTIITTIITTRLCHPSRHTAIHTSAAVNTMTGHHWSNMGCPPTTSLHRPITIRYGSF
jgi:hypothetical protein